MNADSDIKFHLVIPKGSPEERKYMDTIKCENEAFCSLMEQKSRMPCHLERVDPQKHMFLDSKLKDTINCEIKEGSQRAELSKATVGLKSSNIIFANPADNDNDNDNMNKNLRKEESEIYKIQVY